MNNKAEINIGIYSQDTSYFFLYFPGSLTDIQTILAQIFKNTRKPA